MDLGDKTSRYCMLSKDGEIFHEGEVPTTKAGMVERSRPRTRLNVTPDAEREIERAKRR